MPLKKGSKMNKKFLISWVVVFVAWMAGSVLLHGVMLGEDYSAMTGVMRTDEAQEGLMHFMLLAHVLMAGAFVWIYQRGIDNNAWMQQGLRFGIAVSIMAPIPTYMIYYVVQDMSGMLAVKQAVGDSVLVVVLALIVAALNKPVTSAS